ncbi:fluoride efflux transporter FluC [Microbacterium halophytorum]|uniref:fluoride efflux transporter FluC n=1 Tax=Microbacterium halophytorum TaxID=2067568 RepID=UPI000CFB3C2E|nr:CrcB family protein [Microbacterium halophytorum]
MTMWETLSIALGGGLGAGVRWVIDQSLRTPRGFPWAILLVNVTGCFAMALAHFLIEPVAPHIATALAGFLGGYTTFSTVNVGAVVLWGEGRRLGAVGNAAGTLAACVAASALGWLAVVGLAAL